MNQSFEVWHADNMPVQAPFYKSPSIPYGCRDHRGLNVYCRAKEGVLKKYLEPTPFEWITDDFLISFGDYANGTSAVYHDIGFIVPVKYGDLYGGCYLFEYEDLASSVAAGRELWGYPKKTADFEVENRDSGLQIRVTREGKEIVKIEAGPETGEEIGLPDWKCAPHLLLYTMPRYAGPGIQFQKILKRDTSPDYILKERAAMKASVKLSNLFNPPVLEPVGELQPEHIYGAVFQVGDFQATPEHGWAELVDVVIPDPDSMG